jgi:hypothetical protein
VDGVSCLDNVDVGGITLKTNDVEQYYFLMAMLNSKALNWIFTKQSVPFRGAYYSANRQFIESLPIPVSQGRTATEVAALANEMLFLHKILSTEQLPQRREQIQREIDATDQQIDQLVYRLYGLTEGEIDIVEAAATPR